MTHFDIASDNRLEVVARLTSMVQNAPPDVIEEGRYWYEQAHDSAPHAGYRVERYDDDGIPVFSVFIDADDLAIT